MKPSAFSIVNRTLFSEMFSKVIVLYVSFFTEIKSKSIVSGILENI